MKLSLVLTVLALATPLAAQTEFYADVEGSQEVPLVVSSGGGWAHLTLNSDNSVTYDVRVFGISATAAHIHTGAVGAGGGILAVLSGGPSTWSGTTSALSFGEVQTLQTGGLYVNVHTSANPSGELRGQIFARPLNFATLMNEAQENPPTGSGASGGGTFVLDDAGNWTYDVAATGMTVTNAHMHEGVVGQNGGIFESLTSVGPNTFQGNGQQIDGDQIAQFQAEEFYVNFHSAVNPPGEIRGQIIAEGIRYGDIDKTALTFDVTGAPMDGATITLSISGGAANSSGFLLVSLGPGAAVIKGAPFLLDAGTLILTDVLLPLGPAGSIDLPTVLPDLGFDVDLFFQFFNVGGSVESSNAVRVKLKDIT